MGQADASKHLSFLGWAERRWIIVFCVVAAIRVFIFCAAFPFFNNVDEQEHFDLVMRYSRGEIPRTLPTLDSNSTRYIALAGSPEYRLKPEQFLGGVIPAPLWRQPPDKFEPILARRMAARSSAVNHEAQTAPLYYSVAGLWLRIGRLCGQETVFLLYWIRFLNVFIAIAVVWLTFIAARILFPRNGVIRLLAPALAAVFPQSTFYSIQSDVLSPLCFGAAFVCIALWFVRDELDVRMAVAAGLALGATGLVKISNLPLVAVAIVMAAWAVWTKWKIIHLRTASSPAPQPSPQREENPTPPPSRSRGYLSLLALIGLALLPVAGWFLWCSHAYGDLTGSKAKIALLGWTTKPFADWWSHPIFTPKGIWIFVRDLVPSFWRGEFVWHNERMASPLMDGFYLVSSIGLCGLAAVNLVTKRNAPDGRTRKALWLGLLSLIASAVFLAWLSVSFDFGACAYPSRAYPYFTSGRLITGTMIPFFVFYAYGFDRLLSRLKERTRQAIALVLVAVILAGGSAINAPAFSSEYNWFHLWM